MNLEGKLFIRERLINDNSARNYVIKTVLNDIDQGSEFEQRNSDLIKTNSSNPAEYMKQLAQQGYDVMIGYENEKIIGHMVFQEHKSSCRKNWQIFRIYTILEKRGQGYTIPLSVEFLKKACQHGITKVRLGGGKNPIMSKIAEGVKMQLKNIEVDLDSLWVTFTTPQNPPSP